MSGFASFIGYIFNLFSWIPAGWMVFIRIVLVIFFVWSILRLIAAILDALPFL